MTVGNAKKTRLVVRSFDPPGNGTRRQKDAIFKQGCMGIWALEKYLQSLRRKCVKEGWRVSR